MGDSSECCSPKNSQLFPTDIEYMDNVSDSEEDDFPKKTIFNSGSNYMNGDFACASRDVRIQMEDLDAPVPLCPDTDASCSDTNGQEENVTEKEPKISSSEALGREANGFDEAAEVEGSEEDIRTGSPTGSSDGAQSHISDEDVNQSFNRYFQTPKRTNFLISRGSTLETDIPYKPLPNVEDDNYGSRIFASNGSSNPHCSLYPSSPEYEMQEFIGEGENTITYNHSGTRDLEKRIHRTTDTYMASALTNRRLLSSKSEIDKPVSFSTLHPSDGPTCYSRRQPSSSRSNVLGFNPSVTIGSNTSFMSNTRTPLPSSCSPSISGSSSRTILPYETPPYNEKELVKSAAGLISDRSTTESPRGMPRAEPILSNDDNDPDTAGNETEAAKKKKKKKKRSGNKGGETVDGDKKQGRNGSSIVDTLLTDSVQEVDNRARYPPYQTDTSSSAIMDQNQRLKLKQMGKGKKKNENKIYARDMDGNRGTEDLDILLCFVEGKKKPSGAIKGKVSAASATDQKKKQKKQKVVTRPVANDAALQQGSVMGSVVEEPSSLLKEGPKLEDDSQVPIGSDSGVLSFENSPLDSHAEVKVVNSCNQSADVEKDENADKVTLIDSELTHEKGNQFHLTDTVTDDSSSAIEVDKKLVDDESEGQVQRLQYLNETSPASVSDLEFTNFEGLVDHYSEQPFEKYVGRKKKQRQQQLSTFHRPQGYSVNSSFGQTRARWQANQSNHPHLNNSNNRVHGNGLNHSAQSSHGNASASKIYANQGASRFTPNSTANTQSFAAKASSSRVPQQIANDQRKSVVSAQCLRSPPSAVTSAAKSPPPREEFPPLRPTSDAQTTKKEGSSATSVTTTSSPAPCKNVGSNASADDDCSSLATGDKEPLKSKVSERRGVLATPSGDVRDIDTVDLMKIQQFIEKLYPKQNETCYFYSETAKRQHFLNICAKSH